MNLTGVNLHIASNDHLEAPAAVNLSPVVRNQKATDLKSVKLDSNSLAPEDEEEEQYIEICGQRYSVKNNKHIPNSEHDYNNLNWGPDLNDWALMMNGATERVEDEVKEAP